MTGAVAAHIATNDAIDRADQINHAPAAAARRAEPFSREVASILPRARHQVSIGVVGKSIAAEEILHREAKDQPSDQDPQQHPHDEYVEEKSPLLADAVDQHARDGRERDQEDQRWLALVGNHHGDGDADRQRQKC
jgi:hypothetical protein